MPHRSSPHNSPGRTIRPPSSSTPSAITATGCACCPSTRTARQVLARTPIDQIDAELIDTVAFERPVIDRRTNKETGELVLCGKSYSQQALRTLRVMLGQAHKWRVIRQKVSFHIGEDARARWHHHARDRGHHSARAVREVTQESLARCGHDDGHRVQALRGLRDATRTHRLGRPADQDP